LKRTGEDQYDMSGITRSTVVPTSIKLLFGTNATSAVVNFSDYSLFPGLIQDTGGEITRGADVEYSFVRITNDGVLQLEGNAYGDYLEITPLDIIMRLLLCLRMWIGISKKRHLSG
jgi:hypothetical protein